MINRDYERMMNERSYIQKRGDEHHRTKFTSTQKQEMRECFFDFGMKKVVICKTYGVSRVWLNKILKESEYSEV